MIYFHQLFHLGGPAYHVSDVVMRLSSPLSDYTQVTSKSVVLLSLTIAHSILQGLFLTQGMV